MNKIGIHLSIWADKWTDSFINDIKKASVLGFDSVEIPLMDPHSIPADSIAKLLREMSLTVYTGTGLSRHNDITSDDPKTREAGEKHLISCIDIARKIGSNILVGVIHSAWGKRERITDREIELAAISLRKIAKYAEQYNIKIALECINRYENSFLNTIEQGLKLLEIIDMSNAGLHLDTYHMNIEEKSITGAIENASERLFHMHLSENDRGYPGNGHLPWRSIFQTLKKINYKGGLIIESYVFPGTSAADDVSIWRMIEKDRDVSLKEAIDFLRKLI